MPFDPVSYSQDTDGGVTFAGTDGASLRLPPTPAVRAQMARIDEQMQAAQQVAPVAPVGATVAVTGATTGLGQSAPGGAGEAPPAPPPIVSTGPADEPMASTAPMPTVAQMAPGMSAGGHGSADDPMPIAGAPGGPPQPKGKIDPNTVQFASPSAMGAGPDASATPDLDTAAGRVRAINDRILASPGTPYYRIAGHPEFERRTNVQRERELGPDPALIEERNAIESGPSRYAPTPLPAATIRPWVVRDLFEAPPEAKTEAQKEAWATGVAKKAAEDGTSMATLAATMPERRIVAPKNLNGELVDQYESDKRDERAALVRAVDEKRAQQATLHHEANAQQQAMAQKRADDYGQRGILGGEERKGELAADESQAVADAAGARAAKNDEYATQKRDLYEEQASKLAKITGDIDTTLKSVRDAKVDPDKFWKDKSTGTKLAAAIFQALGAYGAAITHSPNFAMQIMDNAVQQNIDAQVKNIEKQKGDLSDLQMLYKSVLDQTGSKVAAVEAMKSAAFATIDDQLAQKAAIAGTEKARVNAQQIRGRIRLGQIDREAAISAAVRGKEATASRVIPEQAARVGGGPKTLEQQLHEAERAYKSEAEYAKAKGEVVKATGGDKPLERFVVGGTTYEAPNISTPTEGADIRKKSAAANVQQVILDKLKKLGPYASKDPTVNGQQRALILEFTQNDQAAKGEGITHEADVEASQKTASDFFSGEANVANWEELMKRRIESQMEQAGARPARTKK